MGRAPRTKETLPNFLKWRRVTRHPLVFRGLTGSQRIPGFWGVTNEIFFPMVRHTSIKTMLSLVAYFDMELEQMNVKTTFLHGELEETVYMVQLEGFTQHGHEHLVCKLKKSLYGLRQTLRQ